MARRIARIACLLPLLASLGCAASGADPAYEDGYVRGCNAGYQDGGRYLNSYLSRDEARYGSDARYRAGWDVGHAACYAEQIRTPRIQGGAAH